MACHICMRNVKSSDIRSHYEHCHPDVTIFECVKINGYRSYNDISSFMKHVRHKHGGVQNEKELL